MILSVIIIIFIVFGVRYILNYWKPFYRQNIHWIFSLMIVAILIYLKFFTFSFNTEGTDSKRIALGFPIEIRETEAGVRLMEGDERGDQGYDLCGKVLLRFIIQKHDIIFETYENRFYQFNINTMKCQELNLNYNSEDLHNFDYYNRIQLIKNYIYLVMIASGCYLILFIIGIVKNRIK